VHIIGTMNTADRSVEALDSALRRRFSFKEMPPKPDLLDPKEMIVRLWNADKYVGMGWEDSVYRKDADELYAFLGINKNFEKDYYGLETDNWTTDVFKEELLFEGINLSSVLNIINKRIEKLLNKDHMIGHSYFLGVKNIADLKAAFQNKIVPLLQEYFFGDYGKIGLVIGAKFFKKGENHLEEDFFAPFDEYDSSALLERKVFHLENIIKMSDSKFRAALNDLQRINN